jgi:type IV secretion/conjugal transfer VirB4 family ATPase
LNLNFDFYSLFVAGLQSTDAFVAVFGIIAAAAIGISLVSKIGQWILPQPSESRVADFLPFDKLLSDGITLRCSNGSYVRVFKIDGVDLTSAREETVLSMFEARKAWIDNMADMQITCRAVTIRERVPMDVNKSNFGNKWLKIVDDAWRENLNRIYKNDHYIILSIEDKDDAVKNLNFASQALLANLNDYGVKVMREDEETPAELSPIYPFVRMLNPITKPTPKARNMEGFQLKELMSSEGIHFTGEEGIIKFFSGDKEKYAITMGIRSSGDYMDESMISSLLAIDCEMIMLNNIHPLFKPKARMILVQQQKMAQVTSFSADVVDQYSEALAAIEDSDADHQSLVEYSMSFILRGDSKEEIDFAESEVQRICRLYSVTPVRENWITQATFFNQFPGYDVCGRTYYYLSRIVSLAIPFEQQSSGLPRSDWGEGAITVFRTMNGSPYRFQFHITADESAVAHCCIVGPTGQGKTTLLTFLAGQAMRHEDLKVYFFDRHRGAEIFTHMVKGAYIGFSGERKNVSLNPFDTRDTLSNRAFLRNWLKAITMAKDALSEREASRAVTTAFDYLRPEERTLTNLYKSCFSPTGNMRRELYRWVNPEQYGNIFNSEHDSLDLSANRFVAFDFTEIFDDETLAAASISYIMHRIQAQSTETGTPALVMIDETAPMLKHEMFRDAFIKGLQEGRKKRQAYLCAFQQPNIVDSLGVGDAVRGQCKTMIFFRNTQATLESYAKWNLTSSEYDFIEGKTYRDCPYAILLKRPDANDGKGESIILDVNLSGLGPYLKLYNSGIKNVLLVDSLVKEFGEDGFVTKYLDGYGG